MYITKVSWEIDRNCNADCIHCYVKDSNKSTTLCESDCQIIIDKLCEYGVEELSITGGEPTLSKNIRMIAGYASSKKMEVNVVTNGFSLREEDMLFLEKHNIFPAISFHAGTKQSFERIYRVDGRLFERFLKNLDSLSRYSLSTCLMEENKGDADEMVEIVRQRKEKVTAWSVYNLRQIKRGYRLAKDVSDKEKERIKRYLIYKCGELELPLEVSLRDKRKEDCPLVHDQTSLFIDPNGAVRACYALVDFVSDKNLVEHSVDEVLDADVIKRWKSPVIKFDNRCKAELLEGGYSLDYVTEAGGKGAFLNSVMLFERSLNHGKEAIRLLDSQADYKGALTHRLFIGYLQIVCPTASSMPHCLIDDIGNAISLYDDIQQSLVCEAKGIISIISNDTENIEEIKDNLNTASNLHLLYLHKRRCRNVLKILEARNENR